MIDIEYVASVPQAEDRPPVPGFSAWWDASDAGSIQGGLGNSVAGWRDKSGFNRHLAQTTDANRPYTGSWSQHGRNVIWSDKVSSLVAPTPLTGHPWTLAAAAADTESAASQRTLLTGWDGTGTEWGRIYRPGSRAVSLYSNANISSPRLWERNRPRVVCAVFNGGATVLRVDGAQTTGSTTNLAGATGFTLFGYGLSESWFGWIGEVIVYTLRALTTGELQRTEAYLMRKWGLS